VWSPLFAETDFCSRIFLQSEIYLSSSSDLLEQLAGLFLSSSNWQGSWVANTLLHLGCVCWLSWQACRLKQMLPPATSIHSCLVSPRWKALGLGLHLRAAARWWRPWTRTVCALSLSLEATRSRWWRTRCCSPRSAAVPTSLASDAEISEEIIIPVLNTPCVPHSPSPSPTHTWMGLLPFSWILLEYYTSNFWYFLHLQMFYEHVLQYFSLLKFSARQICNLFSEIQLHTTKFVLFPKS